MFTNLPLISFALPFAVVYWIKFFREIFTTEGLGGDCHELFWTYNINFGTLENQ